MKRNLNFVKTYFKKRVIYLRKNQEINEVYIDRCERVGEWAEEREYKRTGYS
jgi:hypothetical protein